MPLQDYICWYIKGLGPKEAPDPCEFSSLSVPCNKKGSKKLACLGVRSIGGDLNLILWHCRSSLGDNSPLSDGAQSCIGVTIFSGSKRHTTTISQSRVQAHISWKNHPKTGGKGIAGDDEEEKGVLRWGRKYEASKESAEDSFTVGCVGATELAKGQKPRFCFWQPARVTLGWSSTLWV